MISCGLRWVISSPPLEFFAEIIAGEGGVVIDRAVAALGSGPGFPAVRFVEDEAVAFAFEFGLVGFVLFEPVEVFEEEQP